MARTFKVTLCGTLVVRVEGLEGREKFVVFDHEWVERGLLTEETWLQRVEGRIGSHIALRLLTQGGQVVAFRPEDAQVEVETVDEEHPLFKAHFASLVAESEIPGGVALREVPGVDP
jgi:hypothetical protein